jgi:hypothetical protein
LSTNNITGVRGNHDQKVIEWRAWLEWIGELEAGAGSQWLLDLEEKWEESNLDGELENNHDTEMWVKTQMRVGRKEPKWWSKIPEGWILFSDHYRIARYGPYPTFRIGDVLTNGLGQCQRETTNISCLCRWCFMYHPNTHSLYMPAYSPMTQPVLSLQSDSRLHTYPRSRMDILGNPSQLSGTYKNSLF